MNIKERIESVSDNSELIIESGRYFVDETINLKDRKNIKIRANGNVIFDGGIVISKEKIEAYDKNIKMIDLSEYGLDLAEYGTRGFRRSYVNAQNELFINGKPYKVPCYPKGKPFTYADGDIKDCGSVPTNYEYDNRPAVINVKDEKILSFADEDDIYLAGFPSHSWADDCIKIAKIDTEEKTITTTEPHLFGFKATGHSSWYILNCFGALSEPGEYYIDRKNQKLYFICDEEIETIQLSVLGSAMMSVTDCENVSVEGITFENSRNSAIYIEGGNKCTFNNCTFRNLGILAVQIGQGATDQPNGYNTHHGERADWVEPPVPMSGNMGSWHEYLYEFAAWDNNGGFNHSIENCKIYNTGAGGILLSGGNRKNLIPGNNRVHNCEIYEVNRLDKTYKAGVNIMGVGNTVSHCEIYDMPGMGIYLHGNDHIIEYNKIHDVVKSVSDSGAIYMGRDMSEVGNIFRNNYIYNLKNVHPTDLGVCAIYFDDWDIFNAVYDNFFYNIQGGGFCVIHHTCGGLLSFHDNFIIDCVPGIMPDNKSNAYIRMHREPLAMVRVHTVDKDDMHGVDITSEVYREKYPYLYDVYKNDARPEWMYYNNQICYKKYDLFVDGENGDFTQVDSWGKFWRDEFDWMRRTDVVMGYDNDLAPTHRVDFKGIGLIKEEK